MYSRRRFLQLAAGSAAGLVTMSTQAVPLLVPGSREDEPERRLRLHNLHTGETLDTVYWAEGKYRPGELAAIDHLLRDHRSGEAVHMDRPLLDLLHTLKQQVGGERGFEIISGYRSPTSNAKLRSESSGVAKHSLHMEGRAVDIRLPGVKLKHLRQAALSLKSGGVGYYPKSNFVHVDTGRPRFW